MVPVQDRRQHAKETTHPAANPNQQQDQLGPKILDESIEIHENKSDVKKHLIQEINKNASSPVPSHLGAGTALNKDKTSELKPHKPSIIGPKVWPSVHRQPDREIHEQHKVLPHVNPASSSYAHPYGQYSPSEKSPPPRRIVVNQFHASNLLSSRHQEEKAKILTQNGLTSHGGTTVHETSLYGSNFLRDHNSSSIPKSYFTSASEEHCAAEDDSETDSDGEKYVGQPFYIGGEEEETHKQKVGRSNAIYMAPATQEEVEEHGVRISPECVLSASLFPNVAPYLNFAPYSKKGPPMPDQLRRVLKWKLTAALPKIVRRVVLNSGFRLIKNATDWMAVWENYMRSPSFRLLQSHQKFNHLPGAFCLARKDTMWRNLRKKMKKFGAKEFGFMQRTYIMPEDMEKLRVSWPKHAAKLTKWIVKPPASSRGNGIRVVSTWGQFCKDRPMVVQKYIERPLLINESKFDLRLYVAVTSIDPLKIYLYKEGLVRFASKTYSTDVESLEDRCMHLTNYSINKLSESYLKNENFNCCYGHKWTLQALWSCLQSRGVNTKRLWAVLRDLVIRSMICGESIMSRSYRQNVNFHNNCYELFGFDVLLDENMVPWLLEVNISPSLHSELAVDRHVKGPLIQALLNTALYQVPPKLDEEQQANIIRELNIPCTSLCMDKRLFATSLTVNEASKHNIFTDGATESRHEYLDDILKQLQPDDVRCLIICEDELHRCAPLERIFPTAQTHPYIRFMEKPRYYDLLLDAWENRYGNRRTAGIALLSQLCKQGYHLQVSDEAMNREPKSTLNHIDRPVSIATPDSVPESSTSHAPIVASSYN